MMLQPTIVKNVSHPLIASAYIKHRFNTQGARRGVEDVLVLAARPAHGQSTDDVHAALIADMDLILDQILPQAIKVDSVEIRVH